MFPTKFLSDLDLDLEIDLGTKTRNPLYAQYTMPNFAQLHQRERLEKLKSVTC